MIILDNNVTNETEQIKNTEIKGEVVNNTSSSNDIKAGNKKTLPIIICVVGLIFLVVGGVLFFLNNNTGGSGGNEPGTGQTGGGNSDVTFDLSIIKTFSEYKNYKINFVGEMGNDAATLKMDYIIDVDSVNKNMKVVIDMGGFKKYVYYDLNNNMHYISSDSSKVWGKNTNNRAKLPNFDGVITAIKDNHDITDEGNGVFSYKTELVVNGELYSDVDVNASFDNNGYLKNLTYDLSDSIEGVVKYILTYDFSDVNKLGDVTIPDDVINNSEDTLEVVTIDF